MSLFVTRGTHAHSLSSCSTVRSRSSSDQTSFSSSDVTLFLHSTCISILYSILVMILRGRASRSNARDVDRNFAWEPLLFLFFLFPFLPIVNMKIEHVDRHCVDYFMNVLSHDQLWHWVEQGLNGHAVCKWGYQLTPNSNPRPFDSAFFHTHSIYQIYLAISYSFDKLLKLRSVTIINLRFMHR